MSRGRKRSESQGLSICSVLRTPYPLLPLRARSVAAARSRSRSSCRCTVRWKALRSTGCCTCSPVPALAVATAGRAGRRGGPGAQDGRAGPGEPRWGWTGGWSPHDLCLVPKLEGVPLPVPASARERDSDRPGKASRSAPCAFL